MSFASDAFKLSFQISPIILTGGIASEIPGGMLPALAVTDAISFVTGLLSGGNFSLEDAFANFQPLPGSTLISNKVGMYPFANQSVAANAIISEPLSVSLLMICPVSENSGGYITKLASMMALQSSFKQHNQQGGTYTIATPSFFYTDCIMLDMTDVSHSESKQVQTAWKLDFVQPLVSLQDAALAQNDLMSRLTAGTPTSGATSGLGYSVGSPQSLAGPSVVPAASNSAGSGVAGVGNGLTSFQPTATGF